MNLHITKSTRSDNRFVLIVMGLAGLWLCLKSAPLSITAALQQGVLPVPAKAIMFYILYAITLLIACGVTVRILRRLTPPGRIHVIEVCSGILGICGLAMLTAHPSGNLGILGIGLVFVGVFIGSYLALWSTRIDLLPMTSIALTIACSFAVSETVRFVLSLGGFDYLRLVFPLASLLFLLASPLPKRVSQVSGQTSLALFPWGLTATCSILIILWSVVLGMLPQSPTGVLSNTDLTWSYGLSSIILIAMAFFFWRCTRKDKLTRRQFLYPFTVIVILYLFMVTGMIALPHEQFSLFKRSFIAIAQCLEAFALILVVHSAAERKLSCSLTLAVFITCLGSGPWMVVSDVIQSTDLLSGSPIGEWSAFALSFATVIVLVVFLLRAATTVSSSSSKGGIDSAKELCEKAAIAHGLSRKEAEVAYLLYRGYSAKRIATELFISENTVRTHTSCIYRKLDVHSKQDLMILIDHYAR